MISLPLTFSHNFFYFFLFFFTIGHCAMPKGFKVILKNLPKCEINPLGAKVTNIHICVLLSLTKISFIFLNFFTTNPRGGHSIVKLNTTSEQSLLPLYYML